jgi:hypothetical protein
VMVEERGVKEERYVMKKREWQRSMDCLLRRIRELLNAIETIGYFWNINMFKFKK